MKINPIKAITKLPAELSRERENHKPVGNPCQCHELVTEDQENRSQHRSVSFLV